MPFKTFVAGTEGLASDVNTYLMNQSVIVFADEAERTSELASPIEGMTVYLEDTNQLTVYTGSAWIPFDTGWKTYTPTLPNVTLGNGTLSAFYVQIGKTVLVNLSLVFGSTTAITGDPYFSLPVNHANTNRSNATGSLTVIDASPVTRYRGSAYPGGTPSNCYIRAFSASGAYVTESVPTATVPITFTTSDIISVAITYQAA